MNQKLETISAKASLQIFLGGGGGLGVAQSVERTTPGEAVVGSISVVSTHSLLLGSVSL